LEKGGVYCAKKNCHVEPKKVEKLKHRENCTTRGKGGNAVPLPKKMEVPCGQKKKKIGGEFGNWGGEAR